MSDIKELHEEELQKAAEKKKKEAKKAANRAAVARFRSRLKYKATPSRGDNGRKANGGKANTRQGKRRAKDPGSVVDEAFHREKKKKKLKEEIGRVHINNSTFAVFSEEKGNAGWVVMWEGIKHGVWNHVENASHYLTALKKREIPLVLRSLDFYLEEATKIYGKELNRAALTSKLAASNFQYDFGLYVALCFLVEKRKTAKSDLRQVIRHGNFCAQGMTPEDVAEAIKEKITLISNLAKGASLKDRTTNTLVSAVPGVKGVIDQTKYSSNPLISVDYSAIDAAKKSFLLAGSNTTESESKIKFSAKELELVFDKTTEFCVQRKTFAPLVWITQTMLLCLRQNELYRLEIGDLQENGTFDAWGLNTKTNNGERKSNRLMPRMPLLSVALLKAEKNSMMNQDGDSSSLSSLGTEYTVRLKGAFDLRGCEAKDDPTDFAKPFVMSRSRPTGITHNLYVHSREEETPNSRDISAVRELTGHETEKMITDVYTNYGNRMSGAISLASYYNCGEELVVKIGEHSLIQFDNLYEIFITHLFLSSLLVWEENAFAMNFYQTTRRDLVEAIAKAIKRRTDRENTAKKKTVVVY
jgi:hypothetical protein